MKNAPSEYLLERLHSEFDNPPQLESQRVFDAGTSEPPASSASSSSSSSSSSSLQSRIAQLEDLLQKRGIPVPPADDADTTSASEIQSARTQTLPMRASPLLPSLPSPAPPPPAPLFPGFVAGPASPLLKDPRFATVIPRALLQNLVKHQAEGVVFLLRNLLGGADEPNGAFSGPRGCVLADGMGLGKSVQILTAAYIFMRECRTPTLTLNLRFSLPSSSSSSSSSFNALPARGRVLLIAPLTVHPQWVRECDRLRVWLLLGGGGSSGGLASDLPSILTLDAPCNRGAACRCRSAFAPLASSSSTAPDGPNVATGVNIKSSSMDGPVIDLVGDDDDDAADGAETDYEDDDYQLGEGTTLPSSTSSSLSVPVEAPLRARSFGLLHELAIINAWATDSAGSGILLLNYHMLSHLLDARRARAHPSRAAARELLLKETNLLVLDEAHHIRNPKSVANAAVSAFVGLRRRVAVTGYPLQNSMMDLYSLLDFVRPQGVPSLLIGDPNMFRERYVESLTEAADVAATRSNQSHIAGSNFATSVFADESAQLSARIAAEFRALLASERIFLRRGPHVLESVLPTRIEYIVRCRMPPLQYAMYALFMLCAQRQRQKPSRDAPASSSSSALSLSAQSDSSLAKSAVSKSKAKRRPLVRASTVCLKAALVSSAPASASVDSAPGSLATETDQDDSPSHRYDESDNRGDAAELSTDYDDDGTDVDVDSDAEDARAEDMELDSNAGADSMAMSISMSGNVAAAIAMAAEEALTAIGITADDVASLPSAAWMGRNFLHAASNAQLILDHPAIFVQYPLREASAASSASSTSSNLAEEQRKGEWAVAAIKLCMRALPPAWLTNESLSNITGVGFGTDAAATSTASAPALSVVSHLPEDARHSGKISALLALIAATQCAGERIVVFSRWTLTLDLVARALQTRGIAYRRIDGATTNEERAAIVDEFKPGGAAGAAHVVLVSTKCGAEGINLAGANRVALMGVSWNPNDDLQVCRPEIDMFVAALGLLSFCEPGGRQRQSARWTPRRPAGCGFMFRPASRPAGRAAGGWSGTPRSFNLLVFLLHFILVFCVRRPRNASFALGRRGRSASIALSSNTRSKSAFCCGSCARFSCRR